MREHNKEYRTIANRLIRKEEDLMFIKEYDIKVAYLESDEEKKKNYKHVLGDCTKVDEKYKWCCKYDFFITIYKPNILELNDDQIEILILHELHHIGVDENGEEPKYYVVPHDVEEFDTIIERYGLHWERGEDGD